MACMPGVQVKLSSNNGNKVCGIGSTAQPRLPCNGCHAQAVRLPDEADTSGGGRAYAVVGRAEEGDRGMGG